ncbi:ribosome-associated protein [Shewanella eurypsychrophilus]|uniref:Dual-action ribosomal maturation protein DarP n=1 Tax=Shewanella eurypsychrophilus TaxID=2593656 RepID=A0ABX6VAX6_9GAMM|nr:MULTISPECIES: ribosome biogenesis factor YjgA [Shewanella]QFU24626.1 ribosome-associated protein [Shewanella sp. YLB-09]QPG59823.1 ribosome-associated protein [Shewanella eurypsychrophilus]
MKVVGDSEHFKQPLDHDENYISRADIKREIAIYQELGIKVASLSKTQIDKLNLDEHLYDNVLKTKTIKINTEAYRRHLQYLGKLMRFEDIETLQLDIKNVLNQNSNESAKLNVAEKLKDQLLVEGDTAIQTLIEKYPELDRQKLRQFVRQTKKELSKKPDEASKTAVELVKYLRSETSE